VVVGAGDKQAFRVLVEDFHQKIHLDSRVSHAVDICRGSGHGFVAARVPVRRGRHETGCRDQQGHRHAPRAMQIRLLKPVDQRGQPERGQHHHKGEVRRHQTEPVVELDSSSGRMQLEQEQRDRREQQEPQRSQDGCRESDKDQNQNPDRDECGQVHRGVAESAVERVYRPGEPGYRRTEARLQHRGDCPQDNESDNDSRRLQRLCQHFAKPAPDEACHIVNHGNRNECRRQGGDQNDGGSHACFGTKTGGKKSDGQKASEPRRGQKATRLAAACDHESLEHRKQEQKRQYRGRILGR